MSGKVLNIKQAAARLGVSPQRVHDMIKKGEIAAFQTGEGKKPRKHIYESVIRTYIEDHTVIPLARITHQSNRRRKNSARLVYRDGMKII